MPEAELLPPLVFTACAGAVLLGVWLSRRSGRLEGRLRELSGRPAAKRDREVLARLGGETLPKLIAPLFVANREQRTLLQSRLLHAGLYRRQAMQHFLAVKLGLVLLPWLVGLALGLSGVVSLLAGATGAAVASAIGLVLPGAWLDRKTRRRRSALRRGLFDVLDVLVLSLEAGQSLPSAFQLVANEMRRAHPQLGFELRIALREMQMGCTLSQSLRNLADRCGLEEVGVLASIVEQTERLGASLVRALRVQAEQLRFRRTQQAEERAQKAAARIMFPTLLFIFPAIFIILLGPAALQVKKAMEKRKALMEAVSEKNPLGKLRP